MRPTLLVFALALAMYTSPVRAQLADDPVLRLDPGMQTGAVRRIYVDADGGFWSRARAKTIRVWSLVDGTLLLEALDGEARSGHRALRISHLGH